ncbi:TetR/AcrR family transcriptional regulator [Streptomyces sp. NPDC002088]|uniref:TetR/AcrR family transcriptional regulator n=1 Tax=Streptomyces sp. NPDC002088 TaxID=3154665 RepID=UPI00331722B8
MPRHVDHEQRKRDITAAAMRILAERGLGALTLKSLAKELGGSITLVTHFYATRAELLQAITETVLQDYDVELAGLEEGADARERLQILLEWMLPLDEEAWIAECGRVALIGQREDDPSIDSFFDLMDTRMREYLRDHLRPLVEEERLEPMVDVLRVTVNGIVLAAVEHREEWPAKRQLAVLGQVLAAFDL